MESMARFGLVLGVQSGIPPLDSGVALRELIVIFLTIFVAEPGDKTQLATPLFASERRVPAVLVFAASAGALVIGAALAVAVVTTAVRYTLPLKPIASVGFVAIGARTLPHHFAAH